MKRLAKATMVVLVVCNRAQALAVQQRAPQRQNSSSSHKAMMADYTAATASLFNNMRTPASIIAGAMVPIGFLSPLEIDPGKEEGRFAVFLRRVYPLVSVLSLCSHLLSVMWATVAVNQLTESTAIEATSSVWHLIQRDFYLPWVATNSHFVIGMMGFMWVISSRAYFLALQGPAGLSAAGVAFSSLLLMISIVNRGIAAGGGNDKMRFGSSVLSLLGAYASHMVKRASSVTCFNPMELAAVALFVVSLGNGLRIVVRDVKEKSSKSV